MLQMIFKHFTVHDIITWCVLNVCHDPDKPVNEYIHMFSKSAQQVIHQSVLLLGARDMTGMSMRQLLFTSWLLLFMLPWFTVDQLHCPSKWIEVITSRLIENNVNVKYNIDIIDIRVVQNQVVSVIDSTHQQYYADLFVCCVPLQRLYNIVKGKLKYYINTDIPLETFVHDSTYIGVGFSFFFKEKPSIHSIRIRFVYRLANHYRKQTQEWIIVSLVCSGREYKFDEYKTRENSGSDWKYQHYCRRDCVSIVC